MERKRVRGLGLVVAALVVAVAGACAVPIPGLVSPVSGSSAPANPFGGPQVATVSLCSANGGPVHIVVDVSNPGPDTELMLSFQTAKIRFSEDPDSFTVHSQGGPAHQEYTSYDALDPGECESVSIRSSEFLNSDPWASRPFTFTVSW